MLRAASLVTTLVLAASVAGCGSDDEETAAGTTTATTATAPATTAATDPAATTATTATTATAADPGTSTTAGGGGDATVYARTYERECAKLVGTLAAYRDRFSGSAPADRSSIVRIYRDETTELLDGMAGMFRTLADVAPPAQYAEFQRSIVAVLPQVELKVDRAKRVISRLRTPEDAPAAGNSVKRALSSISSDSFPTSLRRHAPSCLKFG